jgi:hypothetical protein
METEQREPQLLFLYPEFLDTWAKRIADHARKGATLGIDCGKMCVDCAFKYDQPRNVHYLEAVDGAVLMLSTEGNFHCHTADGSDAAKPCAGFAYATAYINSIKD